MTMQTLVDANQSCLEQGIRFLGILIREQYERKQEDLFGSTEGSAGRI